MSDKMRGDFSQTTFSKTYSVTVTFSKKDENTIDADDVQAAELRSEIQAGIERACRRTKGIYQSQPGTVTET